MATPAYLDDSGNPLATPPQASASKTYLDDNGNPAGPGRGGSTPPPTDTSQPGPVSRFLENAASAFNPLPGIKRIFSDPMGPEHGAAMAIGAPMVDQARTAVRAARGQGEFSGMTPVERGSSAFGHGLAAALPIVGPAAANAGDQIGSGDYAGGLGSSLGLVGSVLAPGAIARGVDAIPRMGRASANFDTVMNGARNEPINTAPARAVTDRALILASRGGTAPKVVNDFAAATTPSVPGTAPPPVTYEAGRDFASNAGRLSTTESQAMKGDMGRQVNLLAQALNDANRDAAARVGLGNQYDAAMREYRQASQLRSGIKTAAKVAVPVVGGGALLHLARKYVIGEP